MDAIDIVRSAVAKAVWRLRWTRIFAVLVRVGVWAVAALLAAMLVTRLGLIVVPTWVFLIILVATGAVLLVKAVRTASQVTLPETAKVIDDHMGLKDRLTSSLYFAASDVDEPMMRAAITDAAATIRTLDTRRVSTFRWPRASVPFFICLALVPMVWLGPAGLRNIWRGAHGGSGSGSHGTMGNQTGQTGPTGVAPEDNSLTRNDSPDKTKDMEKLTVGNETPPSEQQDYARTTPQENQLSEEDLKNLAKLSSQELDQLTKEFTDKEKDEKRREEQKQNEPLKLAPLDSELIADIIASEKKKVEKQGSDDNSKSLMIPIKSSEPGPPSKGPRTRGGGHGGGDVGQSGDTRIPPRRVAIAGRAKVLIESLRSKDNVDKAETPRVVMTPLMMKVSVEGVNVTATSQAVDGTFAKVTPERMTTEEIPLGMRRYVQRYFEQVERTDKGSAAPSASADEKETQ